MCLAEMLVHIECSPPMQLVPEDSHFNWWSTVSTLCCGIFCQRTIFFTDAPEYSGRSQYQANEGARDFRIQLTLDSNPIPSDGNFSWFFNDQPLVDGEDGVVLGVDFLQIGNVSRGNAGSYRVVSSNIAGSRSFTFQLVVNREFPLV